MKHLKGSLAAIGILALAGCGGDGGGGSGAPGGPSAVSDFYATDEDSALVVAAAAGVLHNDSPSSSSLTAVLVTAPTIGTLSFQVDGGFTYTPGANANGSDSFWYRATDGGTSSAPTKVDLGINPVPDAPVAAADLHVVAEDATLTVAAPGVLANDSDGDADAITALLSAGAAHGTVSLQANGGFTYTPATDYSGPDSFTYRAKDAALFSAFTTVSITVTPVNDVPTAINHVYSSDALGHLTVAAPGILAGAADADADPLTATLSTPVSSGTLALAADGSFTFAAASTAPQAVSFSYAVSDGTAASTESHVWILVNETDPGPIYGSDYAMVRYPAISTTPTEVWAGGGSDGFVVDRTGTYAYSLLASMGNSSDAFLHRIKLSDGTSTLIATLPYATVKDPVGLDYDSADRLYTAGIHDGKVVRIDPSTGSVTVLGTLPALPALLPGAADLAVGPDDKVYVCPLNASVGGTWVYRFDPATGITTPWASAPANADSPGGDGLLWMGGIAMDALGNCYVGNLDSNQIIRHRDANADGDATDGGETVTWCTLPYAADPGAIIVMGIGLAANGSVMINARSTGSPPGGPAACALYWLRDRNGDGDAADAGEAIPYSTTWIDASFDLGCVGGKR